ncbi:MAG: phenylalanine--tRNA ligase subunit beta [Candidatus Latescibacterota bacterium]|nr:MAG: phenylalanine--tRNA ligase subunit beta [Candidatus Latescibacterota bacterium]
MLISLSWLKKYVQIPDDTRRLAKDLTMLGLNVEQIEERGLDIRELVVGKVLEAGRHPNADRLSVCRVQVGDDDVREIVCGAPNVAAGQTVPVALPGALLPNGVKIKKSKIRGQRSEGMICSEIELGIGDDAAGIIVLDGEHEIGSPAGPVLVDADTVFDIEVTPNRPDLLSHIGVAREVAALYRTPVNWPIDASAIRTDGGAPDFRINIDDPHDCARYVGLRVSGIRVGASPDWMASALEAAGVQTVNNVVDVANYVMLEMGQPLHAFDFKRLDGTTIGVRRAETGEKLLALDGDNYELSDDVLVIADEREPVALAGIIGGEETAVHADTTEILIESANFHPTVVRKGRKALGLNTEASYRFERGVDPEGCHLAAERCARLVCDIAGGTIGGVVDNYALPFESKSIAIRQSQTRRILGAALTTTDIIGYLDRFGFAVTESTDEHVTVLAPSYRPDLIEEIDLIEEVARIYGYDRIGKGWSFRCTTFARLGRLDQFVDSLSDHLAARGFSEVIGTCFTDGGELEVFGWPEEDLRSRPIPIRNPLNTNHKYLRTSLLPSVLEIVRHNIDHGVKRIKIYQAGKVFLAPEGVSQLPEEKLILTLCMSLPGATDFWYDSKSSLELFDIKKEIELLFERFGVDPGPELCYDFDGSTGHFAYGSKDGTLVEGGIVSDRIARRFDLDQPIWYANLDLERCYEMRLPEGRLAPLAEYPASKRDLSLVGSAAVRYADIEKALVRYGGRLLESVVVFDVYQGDTIPQDHIAYGVRLSFRSPERTLTDKEIDRVIDKLVSKLKGEFGVELRS